MKKRVLTLLISGFMILTLVGCGDKEKVGEGEAPTVSTEQGENDNDTEEDENNDNEDDEEAEYKTLTTKEAIEFNKKTVEPMEKLFNDKGFSVTKNKMDYDGSVSEGPDSVQYSQKSGDKPYYRSITYTASIKEGVALVSYQFHYYVDAEKIKSGEHELPTSRKLLVVEPYKVMTGKDISNETLDEIDRLIKEKYIDGRIHDEIILETVGAFELELDLKTTGQITFIIKSDGDGNGN